MAKKLSLKKKIVEKKPKKRNLGFYSERAKRRIYVPLFEEDKVLEFCKGEEELKKNIEVDFDCQSEEELVEEALKERKKVLKRSLLLISDQKDLTKRNFRNL